MKLFGFVGLMAALLLSACETTNGPSSSTRYNISAAMRSEIPQKMLAAVNDARRGAGISPLTYSPLLGKAAADHSRDMSKQRRPWHFGSNGSSPLQRVAVAGYQGAFQGEVISETYESELVTISVWMADLGAREVLLDSHATAMGVGFHQDSTGKIWWTLVTGN